MCRYVTTPALVLVWAFGIAMAVEGGWYASGWLKAKAALVLLLSAWHGLQMRTLRRLATAWPAPPAQYPALAMLAMLVVAIVILVVGKPF
jgi:putative membrane protein